MRDIWELIKLPFQGIWQVLMWLSMAYWIMLGRDFAFGSTYGKIKYFYDEDGKKIKEEQYNKDNNGKFEQISYTLFDDEKSQKIFLNSDRVEITYDKKFHLGTLVIEKRRDIYDEHGNLIEIWDDASDKLIEKRFYRFVIEGKQ